MPQPASPVTRVLVVGGGTAGWTAAAWLRRRLRQAGCEVTLVESAEIPTVGVGEATIPSMVQFVRTMGLDEVEFMRRTHATYKLGIRFVDWIRRDHAYWHAFGLCGGFLDGMDLFHFWLQRARDAAVDEGPYWTYSLQALLGDMGKSPRPHDASTHLIDRGEYAYHLDAGALAEYLREIAVGEGVTHLIDDVAHVELDTDGAIAAVDTASGRRLEAELYIDCTGFRGLLIEEALGDPYVDWSRWLPCDRAAVVRLPRDAKMDPFTRSTALDAGWVWRIPLSHRVGSGYVFSSAHVDDDAAARALLAQSAGRGISAPEPRVLPMRVGRRTEFWRANCVSVGLASGFLEPLESTGIFFIQKAVELLIDYFPDRTHSPELRRQFNERLGSVYDETRDFIALHYLLSQRDDSEFWRDVRAIEPPDSLQAAMALYDENGTIEIGPDTLFFAPSHYFVYAGGERLPRRPYVLAEGAEPERVAGVLEEIKRRNMRFAEAMPDHWELIDRLHR